MGLQRLIVKLAVVTALFCRLLSGRRPAMNCETSPTHLEVSFSRGLLRATVLLNYAVDQKRLKECFHFVVHAVHDCQSAFVKQTTDCLLELDENE